MRIGVSRLEGANDHLATKADLYEVTGGLKADLYDVTGNLKADLIKWMVTLMIGAMGAAAGISVAVFRILGD